MQFSSETISFPSPQSVDTPFLDLALKLSTMQSPTELSKLVGYDNFFRSYASLSSELQLYIVITSTSYIYLSTNPYNIYRQNMSILISTLFMSVLPLEKSCSIGSDNIIVHGYLRQRSAHIDLQLIPFQSNVRRASDQTAVGGGGKVWTGCMCAFAHQPHQLSIEY
jgi:hypothetical protein